jgi:hypothetical protein
MGITIDMHLRQGCMVQSLVLTGEALAVLVQSRGKEEGLKG